MYDCFSLSGYTKEGKKSHLETHRTFRHTLHKQPTLTKWWNYNIFVQILYSYFRYTCRLFLVCLFLLLTVILSGLYEKPRRNKDWVTEKVQIKICVNDITFLIARPLFYVTFCCFLRLPSPVIYLLNGP